MNDVISMHETLSLVKLNIIGFKHLLCKMFDDWAEESFKMD